MGGMRNTARFYPFHRYSARSRRTLGVPTTMSSAGKAAIAVQSDVQVARGAWGAVRLVAGGRKPRAGWSCRETGRVVAKNLHACMLQSRHDPPSRGSLAACYQSDGLSHTPHKLHLVVPRNASPGGVPRGCCLPQTCACRAGRGAPRTPAR